MAEQVLKDRFGKRLGTIKEESGKLVIRDTYGKRKGIYDPKDNVTRDAYNKRIGTGNLLTTLL